jgi:outer membrane immunogenic protein
MFRVSFVACAVAFATAPAAIAADIYNRPPGPAPAYDAYAAPAAVPAWSGAYAGVQVGGAFGSVRNKVSGASTRTANTQGAIGGVYGGVNAQVGANFVVGAEADLNVSSTSGTAVHKGRGYTSDSDWNATVRGRVGVALGRFMPYATGGLAFVDNGVKRGKGSDSATETGYALGGGVEGMVSDRITARAEYMYLDTGESALKVGPRRVQSDPSTNVVRAGVGYKF